MATATQERLKLQGLDELLKSGPDWLQKLRRDSLERFQTVPFPSMRDEQWRRTDPERVRPLGAVLTPISKTELRGVTDPSSLKMGGVEQAGDKLFTLAKREANPFTALNGALMQGGAYVSLGKDESTGEGAVFVEHRYKGTGTAAPHSWVEVGRGSSLTVVEVFEAGDDEMMAAPVVELNVGEGATMRYVFVNHWGPQASVVPVMHARVEKDARLEVLFVGFGTALSKCFVESDLVGEGCKSEVLGLVLGQGRQHFDFETQQNHRVGKTVSDVLFHVALNDRARSVFSGNILCEPGAQQIDGYQQNRNLLLSSKARADSMPRLEIEANDVRCTHGASFTTYDADQRFYLQTRGLNKQEAERILVTGFFAEVINRLEHPAVIEWLEEVVDAKMTATLGGSNLLSPTGLKGA